MRTMILTAVFALASMVDMAAQTGNDNLVYNKKVENGQVTAVYTYEKTMDTLRQKLKNVYEYDAQGRVTMREVQKWNRRKKQWTRLMRWTYRYNEGGMTVEFEVWNARKGQYDAAKKRIEYDFISDEVFAVRNFRWDKRQGDLRQSDTYLLLNDDRSVTQWKGK